MRTASTLSPPPGVVDEDLFSSAGPVDRFLRASIDRAALPPALADAVAYAALGPGKRLRPVLCIHTARAAGAPDASAMFAAAALEFMHAFSLVHDDLPGLDNDDLRRGRPTLHRATSEAMAILAGDALHALAFREVLAAGEHGGALASELADATLAMIGGQVYDTLGGFEPTLPDTERVRLIHVNKTGALIRAACRMGAISANQFGPALQRFSEVGEALGLMFQIVDDVIDVTQSSDHAGKKTGKDADAGKLTYPGVLGLEASIREIERLRSQALGLLADLPPRADGLRALCNHLAARTK